MKETKDSKIWVEYEDWKSEFYYSHTEEIAMVLHYWLLIKLQLTKTKKLLEKGENNNNEIIIKRKKFFPAFSVLQAMLFRILKKNEGYQNKNKADFTDKQHYYSQTQTSIHLNNPERIHLITM